MSTLQKKVLLASITALSISNLAFAAEKSFGMLEPELMSEKTILERKVLRYEHQSHPDWGYKEVRRDYFNLLPPAAEGKKKPLRVILHGAAKSADKAMMAGLSNKIRNCEFYEDDNYYVLYLDCKTNKGDWYWGLYYLRKRNWTDKSKLSPTVKRVLSTIEWVVQKHNIDRNRIYLSGRSMGGAGALGLGAIRGDIFAAIKVFVPAGVEQMQLRMNNTTYPDPPPIINASSHVDKYSKNQEVFLDYAKKHKHSIVYRWGTFGHGGDRYKVKNVVNEFPWLEIKRNEAYPVFTDATTSQKYPGLNNTEAPCQDGQINGYFRWKNLEDTSNSFSMELRLVDKNELKIPLETPAASTTDITFRRLQEFKVEQTLKYKWTLIRNKEILQSGEVSSDKQGLITVQRLKIENKPSVLTIIPLKQQN